MGGIFKAPPAPAPAPPPEVSEATTRREERVEADERQQKKSLARRRRAQSGRQAGLMSPLRDDPAKGVEPLQETLGVPRKRRTYSV
tara:strand:- start:1185 stop:1442 length:258 start_codon:yes stop_codon:yes gene_type:complete